VVSGSSSLSMSHNCAGTAQEVTPDLPFHLSGSQKKTAYALRLNCETLCQSVGIERIGFLTLTVGEDGPGGFRQVWDAADASKRIHGLCRRFLPSIFARSIVVSERHKNGAIHFHILGTVAEDIRTGFDFAAVKRGDYSSVSPALRRIWALLRRKLPEFGFGRAQLTPIEKNGEAISAYVSKYVEKNLFNRLPEDKGKKLVRYVGWSKEQLKPNEFSWGTPRASAWRLKVRQLAGLVSVSEREKMPGIFGPRWAWKLTKIMHVVSDEIEPGFSWTWPEREAARRLVRREVLRSRDLVEPWHPNLWRGPTRKAA